MEIISLVFEGITMVCVVTLTVTLVIHEFSVKGFKEQLGGDMKKLLEKLEPKDDPEYHSEEAKRHRNKYGVYE